MLKKSIFLLLLVKSFLYSETNQQLLDFLSTNSCTVTSSIGNSFEPKSYYCDTSYSRPTSIWSTGSSWYKGRTYYKYQESKDYPGSMECRVIAPITKYKNCVPSTEPTLLCNGNKVIYINNIAFSCNEDTKTTTELPELENGTYNPDGTLSCNSGYIVSGSQCVLDETPDNSYCGSQQNALNILGNICKGDVNSSTINKDPNGCYNSLTYSCGNGEIGTVEITQDFDTGTGDGVPDTDTMPIDPNIVDSIVVNPDGSATTTNLDGSSRIDYPDGGSVTFDPDGNITSDTRSPAQGGTGTSTGGDGTTNPDDTTGNGDTTNPDDTDLPNGNINDRPCELDFFVSDCGDSAPSLKCSDGDYTCDRSCSEVGYDGSVGLCTQKKECPAGTVASGTDLLGNPICHNDCDSDGIPDYQDTDNSTCESTNNDDTVTPETPDTTDKSLDSLNENTSEIANTLNDLNSKIPNLTDETPAAIDNPLDGSIELIDTVADVYTDFKDKILTHNDNVSELLTNAKTTVETGYTFSLNQNDITSCSKTYKLDLRSMNFGITSFDIDMCETASLLKPYLYPLFLIIFNLGIVFFSFKLLMRFY